MRDFVLYDFQFKFHNMFTSWKCQNCDYANEISNKHCVSCKKPQTKQSPIGEIINHQQLLFEGYIRKNILNNLTTAATSLMTDDVINLCNQFFTLNIIQLLSTAKEKAPPEFKQQLSQVPKGENRPKFIMKEL